MPRPRCSRWAGSSGSPAEAAEGRGKALGLTPGLLPPGGVIGACPCTCLHLSVPHCKLGVMITRSPK